jgi:hypothetical protein
MVKQRRIGYLKAKRLFHQRSMHSQLMDRKKTSKNLVYPFGKNSYKWAKNPQKYDMIGIDTKSYMEKTIVDGKVYTKYEHAKNFEQAKRQQREILSGFSKKATIPSSMSIKNLQKKSSVRVHIKKSKNNYKLFIRPKQNKFPFIHPVIMQKKQKKRWLL